MRGEEDGGPWRMMEVETHQQRHYSLLTAPQSFTNNLNKNILSTQSKQRKRKRDMTRLKSIKHKEKLTKIESLYPSSNAILVAGRRSKYKQRGKQLQAQLVKSKHLDSIPGQAGSRCGGAGR